MYKDYFGFSENPFSIAPDPRYLYMSEMHQEALAHLNYGAASDGCIILLTGEIGTGKTTICRCFLEQLGPDSDVAIILNPKLTAHELLGAICDEFELSHDGPAPTIKDYIDLLNEYLLQAHGENRQALLVIDEAQNLDMDVLEMLRLLTNLETNKQKLLKIFLLGQSELASILASRELDQISQRITSRYHLKGLKKEDVQAYINHRITVAGGGRAKLFNRRAVSRIYTVTRGIPRLINSLCDRALLGAYSQNMDRVTDRIVKKAAQEILGDLSARPAGRLRQWSLGLSLLAFGAIIALWYLNVEDGQVEPPATPALTRNQTLESAASAPDEGDAIEPEAVEEQGKLSDAELWTLAPEDPDQPRDSTAQTTRIIIEPIEITD